MLVSEEKFTFPIYNKVDCELLVSLNLAKIPWDNLEDCQTFEVQTHKTLHWDHFFASTAPDLTIQVIFIS